MNYLLVHWLGENPVEKIFTSFRILLWSNVFNRLLYSVKTKYLFMFEDEENRLFSEELNKFQLINDEEKSFVEKLSNEEREIMKNRLKDSPLISLDDDGRMMVNIEHVDKDYLLKSSKESSGR